MQSLFYSHSNKKIEKKDVHKKRMHLFRIMVDFVVVVKAINGEQRKVLKALYALASYESVFLLKISRIHLFFKYGNESCTLAGIHSLHLVSDAFLEEYKLSWNYNFKALPTQQKASWKQHLCFLHFSYFHRRVIASTFVLIEILQSCHTLNTTLNKT